MLMQAVPIEAFENYKDMKILYNYIFGVLIWLFESYQITIVLIPTILIISFSSELGPEKIALCGGILQVTGALYGILIYLDLSQYFSKPTPWALFISWWKRFPTLRKDVRVIAGMSVIPMVQVSAKASVWSPDNNELTLEERIDKIVRNQERIRESLEKTELSISTYKNELLGRIENLEESFNVELIQVKSTLESIHMEDFLWALNGLLYIIVGTLFSNFAEYFS